LFLEHKISLVNVHIQAIELSLLKLYINFQWHFKLLSNIFGEVVYQDYTTFFISPTYCNKKCKTTHYFVEIFIQGLK